MTTHRAPSITLADLTALKPCASALKRVAALFAGHAGPIDAATARAAECTFNDISWVASALARTNKDIERQFRLFLADCGARALPIYERSEKSPAPRNAIIAARRFARGEINDAAREAARAAVWAVVRDAALSAAFAVARAVSQEAAWAAAWDVGWDNARDAARAWQFDRLVARLAADGAKCSACCFCLSDSGHG
jgi:hypothetical protein